ncbi:MAG: histone deacetylase [Firmicutes bacterium HGW-Firmicutes-13]|nr:MAG: histone deacetylase [Firmicutes bacterium HGW-Firmicutes-13]
MSLSARTGIVYDDRYLLHETGMHPERKERLKSIVSFLEKKGVLDKLEMIEPRKAAVEEIQYAHTRDYIDEVESYCAKGYNALDMDTIISKNSYEVALLSAGGSITAVDKVMKGELDNVFAFIRPPGHHAEPRRGMGFCLFNNAAIAAYHAMKEYNLERILIVDWDVHHGNGTQLIFYHDPRVLYFSIHQSPAYPGTGMVDEVGAGKGEGYTINVPVPPSTGDNDYELILREILVPVCDEYKPQLIIVSSGQDAHQNDPLAGMVLSSQAYGMMSGIMKEIADKYCGGKVVLLLEGGYNLNALAEAVFSILNTLAGWGMNINNHEGEILARQATRTKIDMVKSKQKQFWPTIVG